MNNLHIDFENAKEDQIALCTWTLFKSKFVETITHFELGPICKSSCTSFVLFQNNLTFIHVYSYVTNIYLNYYNVRKSLHVGRCPETWGPLTSPNTKKIELLKENSSWNLLPKPLWIKNMHKSFTSHVNQPFKKEPMRTLHQTLLRFASKTFMN